MQDLEQTLCKYESSTEANREEIEIELLRDIIVAHKEGYETGWAID